MPTLPTVSVVIPYHDEGDLVNRALESVRTQGYAGELDIIVVDDASRIPATEVVDQKWNARVVRNPVNLHAAASRNVGIRHAKGEYICFLDSDDVYLPERIAPHVAFLEAHAEISLVGSGGIIHRKGRVWEHVPALVRELYPDGVPDVPVTLPKAAADEVFLYYPYHTCGLTARTATLRGCGGFEASWPWGEEWDLQLRILQTEQVAYLPGFVYRYLERAGSLCRTNNPEKLESAARLFRKWRLSKALPAAHARTLRLKEHEHLLLAAQIYLEEAAQPVAAWCCAARAALRSVSVWGIRSFVRTTIWLPTGLLSTDRRNRLVASRRAALGTSSAN